MLRWTIIAAFCLVVCVVAKTQQPPFVYEPSIGKRIGYSEIVCSGTVFKTERTGNKVTIEGVDRDEFFAEAEVEQTFKGTLHSRSIRFRYFDFGAYPSPDYLSPPIAFFKPESRYILFLKHNKENLEVAVPVWQMEVPLAPRPSFEAEAVPPSMAGIADELFFSVRSRPETLGREAATRFTWAEELVGKDAVLAVEDFLNSDYELIRYDAAWWLSFRRLNDHVMDVLREASKNQSIEEWARSGAEARLQDISEGTWVPK